ncbi:hypothetical protein, partial [Streptococcus thermophilus]
SLLSNEITGLLKDSKTNIFKQGEVANFIIELSVPFLCKLKLIRFLSQKLIPYPLFPCFKPSFMLE